MHHSVVLRYEADKQAVVGQGTDLGMIALLGVNKLGIVSKTKSLI